MSHPDNTAHEPSTPEPGGAARRAGRGVGAVTRLLVASAVGVLVGVAASLPGTWPQGLLIGWIAAGIVFLTWMWITIWPMNPAATATHACREDPGRAVTETTVLAAAVASLGAVAVFLADGSSGQTAADAQAALTVVSVALAWATVHTVFTTRYARLYYTDSNRTGVDFNEEESAAVTATSPTWRSPSA